MNNQYLWDRSGPPDPEVERLEETLAPLRYVHRPGLLREARERRPWIWAAVAAALLAAIAVPQFQAPPAPATGWQVASLEGAAHLGGREAAVDMELHSGQLLRTGRDSQLTLYANALGKIDLGPDSEMRAATGRQVLLNRGELHAYIWAPPRQFVVDTPSARAVDLGCEYTINVEPGGDGLIKVSMGWVAFQSGGHESFIPAGAACITRKQTGPGIPFFQDSSESLQRALGRFERGDTAALTGILDAARPRDGLTLWHLLTRVAEQDRGRVFDRFAALVALPPEVTRERVLRQDPASLDLCWNALNLEDTDWWRTWERKW
jgi:hypothetical protein